MPPHPAYKLSDIVQRFGGKLIGDGQLVIRNVASLAKAGSGDLSFFSNGKYRQNLDTTQAGAVILGKADELVSSLPRIITDDPQAYFARVLELFHPPKVYSPGVHDTARLGDNTHVPNSCHIGAYVVLGADVNLGEACVIEAGCVIGDGVAIGERTHLHPRVVVESACVLGRRVIAHSGAVIGADGFGLTQQSGRWVKIPQIGRVVIADDVEIGANTTIDRGALDDTIIEEGVKLDNQIQVAHNVRIGAHTAIAGCVGIAGSTTIGRHCTIGGGAGLVGHIDIGDNVHITGFTLVTKSISKPGTYSSGVPFTGHDVWLKNMVQLRRLASLAETLSRMEAKLKNIEQRLGEVGSK